MKKQRQAEQQNTLQSFFLAVFNENNGQPFKKIC